MITLILLGALVLGVISWALGGAAIFRWRQELSALSLGSCAIVLLLSCIYFCEEVQALHWDNLTDTADALLFAAAVQMIVALLLNAAAWAVARLRGRHRYR